MGCYVFPSYCTFKETGKNLLSRLIGGLRRSCSSRDVRDCLPNQFVPRFKLVKTSKKKRISKVGLANGDLNDESSLQLEHFII